MSEQRHLICWHCGRDDHKSPYCHHDRDIDGFVNHKTHKYGRIKRPDPTPIVYVLRLEENHIYVGRTSNLPQRLHEHCDNSETEWTHIHPPVKEDPVIEQMSPADGYDEDRMTLEYMYNYGISRVRGGRFASVTLSDAQILEIKSSIKAGENLCYKCSGDGHQSKDCKYQSATACTKELTTPTFKNRRPEIDQLVSEGKITQEFGEKLRVGGSSGFAKFKKTLNE
jgi:hypothetical protein